MSTITSRVPTSAPLQRTHSLGVATITPAKVSSRKTFLGGLEREIELEQQQQEDAKEEKEKELKKRKAPQEEAKQEKKPRTDDAEREHAISLLRSELEKAEKDKKHDLSAHQLMGAKREEADEGEVTPEEVKQGEAKQTKGLCSRSRSPPPRGRSESRSESRSPSPWTPKEGQFPVEGIKLKRNGIVVLWTLRTTRDAKTGMIGDYVSSTLAGAALIKGVVRRSNMGYNETLEFHVDLASEVLGPQFENNEEWLKVVKEKWLEVVKEKQEEAKQ